MASKSELGERNGAKDKKETVVQNVNIEGREKIYISGVLEVISFDEHMIDVKTELGRLLVRGEGLKLVNLSPDTKELLVGGFMYGCEYEDGPDKRRNILRRMTR